MSDRGRLGAAFSPTRIGRDDGACPACGAHFVKVPQRRTACPSCGATISVRTRPFDRKRVLVTDAERDRLEAEWLAFREGGCEWPPNTTEPPCPYRPERLDHDRREWRKIKGLGLDLTIVILPHHACEVARAQEGVHYDVERVPELPFVGCRRMHCGCCYLPTLPPDKPLTAEEEAERDRQFNLTMASMSPEARAQIATMVNQAAAGFGLGQIIDPDEDFGAAAGLPAAQPSLEPKPR